jgi:hypothetical protein
VSPFESCLRAGMVVGCGREKDVMMIYRKESMQFYWDKVRTEGPLRFIMLRGSLLGLIMAAALSPTLRMLQPFGCLLFVVFCWSVGLFLATGTWVICLHRNDQRD